MTALQNEYQLYKGDIYPGQEVRQSGSWRDMEGCIVQTADIPMGRAVSRGSDAATCTLGGASFLGIALRQHTDTGGTGDLYRVNAAASILRVGFVGVQVKTAVTLTDDVIFDATTGEFGVATGTAVPRATYEKAADAGGVAIVRIV